jgi:streptogramin lyase
MRQRLLALIAASCVVAGCSQHGASTGGTGNAVLPVPGVQARARQATAPDVTMKFFTLEGATWPEYITRGPDGDMWFTDLYTPQIGRITPDGDVTNFALPSGIDAEGITEGPDGNIWFSEPGANGIGRLSPSGRIKSFAISGDPDPRGITVGPDKNIWFAEYDAGGIGRVDIKTGKVSQFLTGNSNSSVWDIRTGPDGDLWFTDWGLDAIGRFNPTTRKFDASIKVPGYFPTPWGMLKAADGSIWFTERREGKIGHVVDGKVRSFGPNTQSLYPDALVEGPGHVIWVTNQLGGTVSRFDETTEKFFTAITLPSGDEPTGIAIGPHDNVWAVEDNYSEPNAVIEFPAH